MNPPHVADDSKARRRTTPQESDLAAKIERIRSFWSAVNYPNQAGDMDDEIIEAADHLSKLIAGGDTIPGAIRRLQKYVPVAVANEARAHYERSFGLVTQMQEGGAAVLATDQRQGVGRYPGPGPNDVFWPRVRAGLADSMSEEDLDSVDDASNKIVNELWPPGRREIDTRGLVLGYVQSGKTTNFMAVIAKAADAGYRLFIVLSGITDNLRSQTQTRLNAQLVGDNRAQWYQLTNCEHDFRPMGNAANLLTNPNHRLLAVVKKNPHRLRSLSKWLKSASTDVLAACPILIIDDEADQASIDVGRARTSTINRLIRDIIHTPKSAYVAYTATPFANLLIDAADTDDLYPRDFVIDLPRPASYFGSERLFGREPLTPDDVADDGLEVIRRIDMTEVPLITPPSGRDALDQWEPALPNSLATAIRWFLLATSVRRIRGTGNPHSSMLIHSSMRAQAHDMMKMPVGDLLMEIGRNVAAEDSAELGMLKNLWESEKDAVAPADGEVPAWNQIRVTLSTVVADTRVIVDNYRSMDRLYYDDQKPTTAVVIGGNTLSRGLTLEGLVSSYFVRSASAYDTLLQMGRWFGFRHGYADLARIWMTAELEAWFSDLATVEEEIRRDIRRYDDEAVTPKELAVRIRNHPKMAITAAAKMRNSVRAEVSFSGKRAQTILFQHDDPEWLGLNIEATRSLIRNSMSSGVASRGASRPGRWLLDQVPVQEILLFLDAYQFHDKAYDVRRDLLTNYIQREHGQKRLSSWNVVVMGYPDDRNGQLDLGLVDRVNLIERARLDLPNTPYANIKALISTVDRVADMKASSAELGREGGGIPNDRDLLRRRSDEGLQHTPLLGIYPISKDSRPQGRRLSPVGTQRRARTRLDAADDVIGIALFFPHSPDRMRGISYTTADLADLATPSEEMSEMEEELAAVDRSDEQSDEAEGGRNV